MAQSTLAKLLNIQHRTVAGSAMQHHQMAALGAGAGSQLPGLGLPNGAAPNAANLYKMLQQQQANGKLNEALAGLAAGGDLDMASAALLQNLQRQQQQQQPLANGNNVNQQAAMLALLQANPMLAQLGLGQAGSNGVRPDALAAAAAAAATSVAQQQAANARIQQQQQQAALAAALLRNGAIGNGVNGLNKPGQANAARAAVGNQNAAQLLALQRAATAQLLQQQQNAAAAANQAQLMQAAAALAAQKQQQQQLQAQQMLKAMLERNNPQLAAQQQGGMNPAALLKQLQLQDALAKQDALARNAAAQQQHNAQAVLAAAAGNPALAELLLQQELNRQNNNAHANMANKPAANGNLTMAQLQQLASTPMGQQLIRNMAAGGNAAALERLLQAQQQQQQQQANNNMLNSQGSGRMNGSIDSFMQHQSQGGAGNKATVNGTSAGGNGFNGIHSMSPAPSNSTAAAGSPDPLASIMANTTAANNNGNKEQRRLALACVALQLARCGVSVDQAIQSGIMGGMSVMDVRFIVECYNAERERMAAGGAVTPMPNASLNELRNLARNGTPGPSMDGMPIANGSSIASSSAAAAAAHRSMLAGQSTHTSRTHSPAASIAGSHMSMFGQLQPTTSAPHQMGAHGLPSTSNESLGNNAAYLSTSPGTQAARHSVATNGSGGGSATHANGNKVANGSTGSPHSETTRVSVDAAAATVPSQHFNAFNYGFFGANKDGGDAVGLLGSGELLGELEPEDEAGDLSHLASHPSGTGSAAGAGDGVTSEQLAWLRATAEQHRAVWEGRDGESDATGDAGLWGNNDEITARLASLDLGSGFL